MIPTDKLLRFLHEWTFACESGVLLPRRSFNSTESLSILLVANMLLPVDSLTIELFLDRDMSHACSCSRPMPVPLARREPDHITRMDFLNRTSFALNPSAASGD